MAHVPLLRSYWLSNKKGTEAYVKPVLDKKSNTYFFMVHTGIPSDIFQPSRGTVRKNERGGTCLLYDTPIPFDYIRAKGKEGQISTRLMAIVAEGSKGRLYISPTRDHEHSANFALPNDYPDTDIPEKALGFRVQLYGLNKHYKLFTPRQLTAMVSLSDIIKEIRNDVLADTRNAGISQQNAEEYSKAITTFLALALDRCADFNNSLCRWTAGNQKVMNLFGRQTISMVWDFAEANILGDSVGSWNTCKDYVADCVEVIGRCSRENGKGWQVDAASCWSGHRDLLISTDPPYYDNIGYAALSDLFYIWLRRTIGDLYPELFGTILVPKAPELTAAPEQFDGDKQKAKEHFETGFRKAFTILRDKMDPRFPLTVYYAFKQEDEEAGNGEDENREAVSSGIDRTTGWETLLEALLGSGFQITATWPVRASQAWRMRSMGSNALASYIVLACRPRQADAPQCSRREFLNELKRDLPVALRHLQHGNIAPVDLAQASIGPGMAVFSRYSRVMESSGNAMTVRTALALINQALDEVLAEQEGEFDADTRWALAWFEQNGMEDGEFGVAETLSKAKNTAVSGLVEDGIVSARGGKVRLIARNDMSKEWDPAKDRRLTVWEGTQHLIRSLDEKGEEGAADLLRRLGRMGETARDLSYRLYSICERKKWVQQALAYNSLVIAWPEIKRLVQGREAGEKQSQLL